MQLSTDLRTSLTPFEVVAVDADDALQALDGVVATDLEARTVRAIDQYMTVLDRDQATYEVYSESGRQYAVDVAGDECSCPDHQRRGTECKHLRRVRLETNCDPERWRAVSGEVGAAILGIDEEIHRLEERIRDLVSAQRSLERLLDRMDDHRSQGQPTGLEASSSGLNPADD